MYSVSRQAASMVLSRLTSLGNIRSVARVLGLKQAQSLLPTIEPVIDKTTFPCGVSAVQYRTLPRHGQNSTATESLKQFSTSPSAAVKDDRDDDIKAISEQIRTQLNEHGVGRLFAVVHIDGNQRKVTTEDIIVLNNHIAADIGEKITINKVLMVGSKDFSIIGRPLVSSDVVRVEATVLEKTLSYTRVFFRYLRRQNNKKMKVRKDSLTYLRINAIKLGALREHS